MRVYNFAAGPSTLPMDVLLKAQSEFLDYNGTGMSVIEMSHRSKPFMAINTKAQENLRKLMNIPDNYYILFVQGGASQQFAAVPLNLLKTGKADYLLTGNFATKAYEEATKYGDISAVASSKDKNYTYIPKMKDIKFNADADYVHFTYNNTIYGTKFSEIPTSPATLVTDMSSNILSEEIDVSKFGLIYAGAQKNIAPSGLTIVIVRKDLVDEGKPHPLCPTMLKYSTQAKADSLYNTPNTFSIYMANLVFERLLEMGGVKAMEEINKEKAKILYDYIDESGFYKNPVEKEYRSIMNAIFTSPSEELDAKFVKEAAQNGIVSIKGHRITGGMRASMYNAMPIEGVKHLVKFMQKFASENK